MPFAVPRSALRRRAAWPRRAAVLALLLAVAGAVSCRQAFSGRPAAEDVAFAERYIALFGTRSLPALEMGLDPALRDPQMRMRLLQMAAAFPAGDPRGIHLIGSAVTTQGSTRTTNLAFQYDYPPRYVAVDIVVERRAAAQVVRGVHVTPLGESLDVVNRFTFAGKGPIHYAALAIALAVLGFVLYAFVLALREDIPGSRWPWVAAVFVGVSQFTFNWATGGLAITLLTIRPLGTGFSKVSAYAPLFITVSIPVGAIVFMIQRHEWRQSRRAAAADAVPPATPRDSTASDGVVVEPRDRDHGAGG